MQAVEIIGSLDLKDTLFVDFIQPDDSTTIDIQGHPAWTDTTATIVTVSDTTVLSAQFALYLALTDTNYTDSTDVKGWNYMNEDSVLYATQTDLGSYLALADTNYTDSLDVKGWNFMNEDSALYATQTDLVITAKVSGSYLSVFSADQYMNIDNAWVMSATMGHPMPWDGSIIALAWAVNNGAQTTAGDVEVESYADATEKFVMTCALNGTGDYTFTETAAVGTHTFSAGDILNFRIDYLGGEYVGSLRRSLVTAYLQFDE